ncbi:hypothetical protein [Pedobacter zeae]|nr:hypothetical protein [Pedobacter zeae]MBB4106653.1 hypothetical protein [Pedobacter zeae]
MIIAANSQQVRRLLNWSELQYSDYIAKKGIEYLKSIIDADDWALEQLTKSGQFWKWWRNHWYQRDQVFLVKRKPAHSVSALLVDYDYLHTVAGVYPYADIMEQAYGLLMEGINKKAVKDETKTKGNVCT